MQGYFPAVLSYKDSTISMTSGSCDSYSAGSKGNPVANCYG